MIVDARGLTCPLPVINTKAAIEGLEKSEKVQVLVDNETAVQNLLRFAAQRNFQASGSKKGDKEFEVVIDAVVSDEPIAAGDEEISCAVDARQPKLVVVLSADKMGLGDETLGKNLMKAFVFALTKQDQLPETIVLYNSGAHLSCEGSPALDDLKLLEAEGVEIVTCGTCLEFYGIKEKLAVGSVTNMYEIVRIQEGATTIIRP